VRPIVVVHIAEDERLPTRVRADLEHDRIERAKMKRALRPRLDRGAGEQDGSSQRGPPESPHARSKISAAGKMQMHPEGGAPSPPSRASDRDCIAPTPHRPGGDGAAAQTPTTPAATARRPPPLLNARRQGPRARRLPSE